MPASMMNAETATASDSEAQATGIKRLETAALILPSIFAVKLLERFTMIVKHMTLKFNVSGMLSTNSQKLSRSQAF